MRQAIYVPRKHDEKKIANYKRRFDDHSPEELLEHYIKEAEKGFFGVHQQLLYFLGMQEALREKFPEKEAWVAGEVRRALGE